MARAAKGSAAATAGVQVALLRGINVGGKNKLPMKDLAATFVAAGCSDVETYIQSGNVLFRAPLAWAPTLPGAIAADILKRFGLRVPVLIRSAAELARVARGNPFLRAGVPSVALHVAFLAARPDPRRVAGLDARRSPPDAFAVKGREVYLHLPHGTARSRLTNAWLDSALATTSTIRNWRTVLALLERATAG